MENKEITDHLYFCAAQCSRCYAACSIEQEKDKLQRCMTLNEDCAAICRLTGQLFEKKSENAELFLKLSGEICERCAAECKKHSHLEHCKKCAEACRKCAEMCYSYQAVH